MESWRKSTYSDANGGNCVEVADSAHLVLIRDTTNRDGITLSIPANAWRRFATSLR
jgi:hypothetical protein